MSDKTHYEILGVEETASAKEIKAAYVKLAKVNHPDKIQKLDSIEKARRNVIMRDLNNARDCLEHEKSRRSYDTHLHSKRKKEAEAAEQEQARE